MAGAFSSAFSSAFDVGSTSVAIEVDSYLVTHNDVTLIVRPTVSIDTDSYSITHNNVEFAQAGQLIVGTDSYSITHNAITFTLPNSLTIAVDSYSLTHNPITFTLPIADAAPKGSWAEFFGTVLPSENNTLTRSNRYGPIKDLPIGAPGELNGNYEPALVADVRLGVEFGSEGTEFIGLLDISAEADVPAESDVRLDTIYNSGTRTGTLVLPPETSVEYLVGYGADGIEFIGSLQKLRQHNDCIKVFINETQNISINLDRDHTGSEQELNFSDLEGVLVVSVEDADLTKAATSTSFSAIAISDVAQELKWTLRLISTDEVIAYGFATVYDIP
jgi:hypothetical protein